MAACDYFCLCLVKPSTPTPSQRLAFSLLALTKRRFLGPLPSELKQGNQKRNQNRDSPHRHFDETRICQPQKQTCPYFTVPQPVGNGMTARKWLSCAYPPFLAHCFFLTP
jgi:hypothetical protein